jgi:NAD(P)H dehydrogenase (quinone)
MNHAPLLVTGAAGQLGRRVIELLLERNAGPIVAATRAPDRLAELAARGVEVRRADFDEPASLSAAFQGANRALLISTDTLHPPGRRIEQHTAAVRALAAAGVEHVVYTSLSNADRSRVLLAPDHAATEAALAATAFDFTVLRDNIYTELLALTLPRALESGTLIDARGDGKVAYVSREDCARTAVAALLDPNASGRRTLEVTGPEALGSAELAALVSSVFEREVKHVAISEQALLAGMIEHGLPEPVARVYSSFDGAIAAGELGTTSDTVARLTGRAPRSVREFLLEQRAALSAASAGSR